MINDAELILNQFHDRAAKLRAEAAQDKLARQAESTRAAHQRNHKLRPGRQRRQGSRREKPPTTCQTGVACSST